MPKIKLLKGGRVVTNVLGSGRAAPPPGYASFIQFYRHACGLRDPPCFVEGCHARGATGSHVKLASSAYAAVFKFDWYIVPACARHNKRSSCGSYAVRRGGMPAVRLRPSFGERVVSWAADPRKLLAALKGAHH
jgi:hypothetical protein